MVMQWTVNPPLYSTTGSIPVISTKNIGESLGRRTLKRPRPKGCPVYYLHRQISWLDRMPVTHEARGSSPLRCAKLFDYNHCMIYNDNMICDCGEIGRHKRLKISRLTASRFDSGQSHQRMMPLQRNWLAQWTHNPLVPGSSPGGGTKYRRVG